MAAEPVLIKVDPKSELALVVRDVAEAGEPLLVGIGDDIYELQVHEIRRTAGATPERDSLFNIVGISTEGEPTDIARNKLAYLADALTPRTQ